MTPVVWSTAVTPLTNSVWRTDTLTRVGITVISHMTALAGCKRERSEVNGAKGIKKPEVYKTAWEAFLNSLLNIYKSFTCKRHHIKAGLKREHIDL